MRMDVFRATLLEASDMALGGMKKKDANNLWMTV